MTPATEIATPKELARTYHSHAYEDPWGIVEDYQRVLEFTGKHPNAKPGYVAKKLELPRGRIRPWIDDGAIPHPVRAIQTAETRGWLPLTERTDTFEPINHLVAWLCSRGSIKADTFSPYFMIRSDNDETRLTSTLETLDLKYDVFRTDDIRTTEITLGDDGAVLGRILVLLGGPADGAPFDAVPSYLNNVSESARRDFARTYLENRGEFWEFTGQWIIEHQNRSDRYRRSLGSFFADLGAGVRVNEDTINIDTDFVSELQVRE